MFHVAIAVSCSGPGVIDPQNGGAGYPLRVSEQTGICLAQRSEFVRLRAQQGLIR